MDTRCVGMYQMIEHDLHTNPEFRRVFVEGIAVNLDGRSYCEYDDDLTSEEKIDVAKRWLTEFGGIIGEEVDAARRRLTPAVA